MYKECLKIVKGAVRTRFIAVAVPCVDYYATWLGSNGLCGVFKHFLFISYVFIFILVA